MRRWLCAHFGGMFSGLLDHWATQSTSLLIKMSSSLSCSRPSSSDYKWGGEQRSFGVKWFSHIFLLLIAGIRILVINFNLPGYLLSLAFQHQRLSDLHPGLGLVACEDWIKETGMKKGLMNTNIYSSFNGKSLTCIPTYHRRSYLG